MTPKLASALVMNERSRSISSSADAKSALLIDLIERAKSNDQEAFNQLMIFMQKRVVVLCWRILGNETDARDAAQEVFIKVYKHIQGFNLREDFHGWLYRITINICKDMISKRKPQLHTQLSIMENIGDEWWSQQQGNAPSDTEDQVLLGERRALVERAIAALPQKERIALILREYEGLSTREVARAMNSRPSTVRVQISAAKIKIKRYCERLLAGKQ